MPVYIGRLPDGRWDNFEAEAECLSDLRDALNEGYVVVDILRTHKGRSANERLIHSRSPMLLSGRYYDAIENGNCKFIEENKS